jgi:AraC-like DNA-binding protein
VRQTVSRKEVSLPLDRHLLIKSRSLEEVRQLYSSTSTPTRVELPGPEPFECRLNHAAVGPVAISAIWTSGALVGVAEAPISSYFLGFARAGFSEHVHGRRFAAVVANKSGTCASPAMAPIVRLSAGHQGVQVRIDRTAMETALAALLCVPSRAPLVFDSSFSVTAGFGAGAQRFVDFLIAELERGSATLRMPIVANRWLEGFLFQMILSQPNNHSAQLRARPVAAEPRYVRQVGEYLTANALQPVTLSDLATLTGMSVRSIQAGFRRWHGCTPMEFLRARRFERARDRLIGRVGHPASSVTTVALECGFGHLGRFSVDYRARFGESPADTRRRAIGHDLVSLSDRTGRPRTRG